jgi:hypothetical protein
MADSKVTSLTALGQASFAAGDTFYIVQVATPGLAGSKKTTVADILGDGTNRLLISGAANRMEQRNGANAQEFRVYNTFTDASNGEWCKFGWNANVLEIGTVANGAGTFRLARFFCGGQVDFLTSGTTPSATLQGGSYFNYQSGTIKSCFRGSTSIAAASDIPLAWSSTTDATGAADAYLSRAAANVLRTAKNDGTIPTWLQDTPGVACLASNFTNATATMANTNLSFTVIAGRSYQIEGLLQVSNSTAGEGVQLDFNGGTATATTFFMSVNNIGTVVAGTVTAAALATAMNYTSVTGTVYLLLNGFLKVNAAGTLILRAAENTHSTGTLTIGAGSWLRLRDTVAL